MKNNPNKFSGAVNESFNGRNNENDSATETIPVKLNNTPSDKSSSSKKLNESNNESNIKKIDIINEDELIDQKGRTDKGLGRNADGSFRQSKAGRKPTTKSKKKVKCGKIFFKKSLDTLLGIVYTPRCRKRQKQI